MSTMRSGDARVIGRARSPWGVFAELVAVSGALLQPYDLVERALAEGYSFADAYALAAMLPSSSPDGADAEPISEQPTVPAISYR